VREAAADVFRSRQVFALTAGGAAAVLVVLLLLPARQSASGPSMAAAAAAAATTTPVERAADVRRRDPRREVELEDEVVSPPRRASDPEPVLASLAAPEGNTSAPDRELSIEEAVGVGAGPAPDAHATDFGGIATLCVDLARVVDTRALPSLLDRTAHLLDASGIILWIADPDGRELNPIFAQGYPQQLVNRLGTIPRDAQNATAAAFRTSLLQTVKANEVSSGAIAAPLITPGGCVGVMSAEVRHDSERRDATLAAATIVAAQLATLVGPPAARSQTRSASGA
jgi:hypothetical protein